MSPAGDPSLTVSQFPQLPSISCFSFQGRPDPVHVVMVIECLQKFRRLTTFGVIQLGVGFGNEAKLAGDDFPAVLREPFGNRMDGATVGQKPRACRTVWNIIILFA